AAYEFLQKISLMLIAWVIYLFLIDAICHGLAKKLWSLPVPIDTAFIPSKLPHPNPMGCAIPFDIPLTKASNDQVESFMEFRGKGKWCGDSSPNTTDDHERKDALLNVAICAAEYKGVLFEERFRKYADDHFRLRLPGAKYPYVDRYW
ncbi:hypothetical protein ACHAXS_000806, partial [Conticribra weissflogii]